ncbi:hypothetical protein [Neisseria maigaei]|uniref:hypothetical protein n=1 Tax=Neisseria maigaei TaxID=2830651 RepID=UPI00357125BF
MYLIPFIFQHYSGTQPEKRRLKALQTAFVLYARHNAEGVLFTYSGLNLNQYGVASPCRTICTVCGFVALS